MGESRSDSGPILSRAASGRSPQRPSGVVRGLVLLLAASLVALPAAAAPTEAPASRVTLRLATQAPKGTSWAKAFDEYAAHIEKGTQGAVVVKVYYGGTAGDELEVLARMERGQLDGTISGGPICLDVMPSMRVLQIIGMYDSEQQMLDVSKELLPVFADEAHARGYALTGVGSVGPVILFSRRKVSDFASLLGTPVWTWELSGVFNEVAAAMGLKTVLTSLQAASRAYEDGRTDGFWTTPIAALGFQWYSQVRYFMPLESMYLSGCLLLRDASVDGISPENRAVLREAGSQLALRLEVEGTKISRALVDRVFQKQGLEKLPVSAEMLRDFRAAAKQARKALTGKVVPRKLLEQVERIIEKQRGRKS
jgi:TRAP-type C4-dicarboxylate transport system substrate-binding protein